MEEKVKEGINFVQGKIVINQLTFIKRFVHIVAMFIQIKMVIKVKQNNKIVLLI